jgi:Raf kinase inhibitor-like YbhB/YbcL family protein
MKLWSNSFEDGQPIPHTFALGKHHPETHVELAGNESPHLAWSELPAGTRSLALICVDTDAPTRPDDVNKEGRTVPADLPRAAFHHWVMVDLPADAGPLAAGEFSRGVTPHGKRAVEGPRGTRHGVNDYTSWFAGDAAMEGEYRGYDGPCPPWNDSIPHRYHFTLYALDLDRCPVEGSFTAADVLAAIEGHVLAEASIMGTYAINPEAR